MIHLILPNVGPMPAPIDWNEMTVSKLVQEYEALPASYQKGPYTLDYLMTAIFDANMVALMAWIRAVRTNHKSEHSDLAPLDRAVLRRFEEGFVEFGEACRMFIERLEVAIEERRAFSATRKALQAEKDRCGS